VYVHARGDRCCVSKGPKNRYPERTKRALRRRYPWARAEADKIWLGEQLGICGPTREQTRSRMFTAIDRVRTKAAETAEATGTPNRAAREYAERVALNPRLRLRRDDPAELEWTAFHDDYLRRWFCRQEAEFTAVFFGRTEAAVLWRARELGLRRHPRSIELGRLSAWLGLSLEELRALEHEGVKLHRIGELAGPVERETLGTVSLAAWLAASANLERVRSRGADEHVILDLQAAHRDSAGLGASALESCPFLSVGHTCLTPRSGVCGKLCDGQDAACRIRFPDAGDQTVPPLTLEELDPVVLAREHEISTAG